MSITASASELSSWALGVSYGTVHNWEKSFSIDLQAPTFYEGSEYSIGVVFDAELRELGVNTIDSTYLFNVSALFRRHLYKDLVSSYLRVGLGYAIVDELLHEDESFIFIPFLFGVDLLTFDKDGKYGSFFAEAGFNLDFIDEEENADIHDGVFINLGIRTFF